MSLLHLALLIQILFYIVHHVHFVILVFIILSLGLRKFSENEGIYILLPMVLSHLLYIYSCNIENTTTEGFKKKKGGFLKRMVKKVVKKAKKFNKKHLKIGKKRMKLKRQKMRQDREILKRIYKLTDYHP